MPRQSANTARRARLLSVFSFCCYCYTLALVHFSWFIASQNQSRCPLRKQTKSIKLGFQPLNAVFPPGCGFKSVLSKLAKIIGCFRKHCDFMLKLNQCGPSKHQQFGQLSKVSLLAALCCHIVANLCYKLRGLQGKLAVMAPFLHRWWTELCGIDIDSFNQGLPQTIDQKMRRVGRSVENGLV